MDISDDTCVCWGCGTINVGYTLDECADEGCPECGSRDLGTYEDNVQETADMFEEINSR